MIFEKYRKVEVKLVRINDKSRQAGCSRDLARAAAGEHFNVFVKKRATTSWVGQILQLIQVFNKQSF